MKLELGEEFDYSEHKLRVDKNEQNSCEGCFFYENMFECDSEEVMSKTGNCEGVIFTNIEKVENKS